MAKSRGSVSKNKQPKGLINKRKIQPPPEYEKISSHVLPSEIQTDFIAVPALLTVREALAVIQNRRKKAVVIRRLENHAPLFYLFSTPEIESLLADKNPDEVITVALDLQGSGRAEMISLTPARIQLRESRIERPTVVTDGDTVVGYYGLIENLLRKFTQKGNRPVVWEATDDAGSFFRRNVDDGISGKHVIRRSQGNFGFKMDQDFADGDGEPIHLMKKSTRRGISPKRVAKGKILKPPVSAAAPAAPSTQSAPPVSEPLCHFAAQMPEEVIAGKIQQVEVTLSREEIKRVVEKASQIDSAPLPATPDQKITVRLIPKRNFDIIGDSRADITAPLPGQPAVTLFFDVKPGSRGEGELWVVFCQGPLSLVTLKLKPQVVVKQSQSGAESIQAQSAVTPPSETPPRTNTMRVYLGENGGKIRYRYCLYLDDLDIDQEYESPEFTGDIMTVLKPYMNLFDEVETQTQTDFDQLQIQLRSIGAKLFQTLFPKDLQSVFWENRKKIKHLKLYCEEPYIPWEILHVCEPGKPLPAETRFLGQMGLVRWLHGHASPTRLRVRPGRAWYVTPSYPGNELESAKKEGKLLSGLFGAQPVKPATRTEVTKLLAQKGPFDLFHFAGHGEASEAQITDCRIELEDAGAGANSMLRDLTPDIVSGLCQLKAEDDTRPIVVLNSCRAGKTGYRIAGLGGFAPAFLEREAGVFIGALWMIGDQPALTFIKAFYEALRAGKMVAQAVNAGRKKACQAGDATYLAYVVYADPFAHLVQ